MLPLEKFAALAGKTRHSHIESVGLWVILFIKVMLCTILCLYLLTPQHAHTPMLILFLPIELLKLDIMYGVFVMIYI